MSDIATVTIPALQLRAAIVATEHHRLKAGMRAAGMEGLFVAVDTAGHYWLVTPPSLAHGIDLPATWGLLEPRWQQGAWKLRATRTAPRLQSVPATIDRGLVVGMLHAGMRRI